MARAPTLRKIFSADNRSAPTLISCADSNRACPKTTVQFAMCRSHDSTPVRDCPEISSLRALTRFMSTVGGLVTTPNSAARATMRAA